MSTSFAGCLPCCVKLVLCYYCLLTLWQNKYDDDDVVHRLAVWLGSSYLWLVARLT